MNLINMFHHKCKRMKQHRCDSRTPNNLWVTHIFSIVPWFAIKELVQSMTIE